MGTQFVMALIYIQSKREAAATPVFGFQVEGKYLPFALLAIHVLSGSNVIPDIVGILAGHIYYFMKDECPKKYGQDPLRTPKFL